MYNVIHLLLFIYLHNYLQYVIDNSEFGFVEILLGDNTNETMWTVLLF